MKYHPSGYITCKQLLEFIGDYIGGELPAAERHELERHLAVCPPCVRYIDTYKETIRLGKAAFVAQHDSVPPEVPEDLVKAILAAKNAKR
jgi:anti-sigma factor RsiW